MHVKEVEDVSALEAEFPDYAHSAREAGQEEISSVVVNELEAEYREDTNREACQESSSLRVDESKEEQDDQEEGGKVPNIS